MVKRVRYIGSGLADPDDPVSDFRLVAGCILGRTNTSEALRIDLPANLELDKCKGDRYSTTKDSRTLEQLGAVPVVKVDGQWTPMPDLWPKHQPADWSKVLRARGFYGTSSERGYLERDRYEEYLNRDKNKGVLS